MTPAETISQIPFGRISGNVATYLASNFGRWVRTETLVDVAYADDPAGGPDNARNVLKSHVHAIRKKIRPYGLVIEGHSGSVRRMVSRT